MTIKSYGAPNDEKLLSYLEKTFHPEDRVLDEIHQRANAAGLPEIQVGKMDALHLEVLTRASGARKAVEIGTLAGYSGVAILRGLGPGGRLYTFEADRRHAEVARESFEKAGFAERAEIFVGPAIENLPKISSQGPFDLIFIDADKEGYPGYLRWAAENLRVGGMVLADNTFAFGMIADTDFESDEDRLTVEALREFNRQAAQGGRFRATQLPTGEGLTLAVKIR